MTSRPIKAAVVILLGFVLALHGVFASTARIGATEAYELAGRENLQLHGGIGFTWEANCHFHYRRARLLALSLGSVSVWTDQLIESLAGAASDTRSRETA